MTPGVEDGLGDATTVIRQVGGKELVSGFVLASVSCWLFGFRVGEQEWAEQKLYLDDFLMKAIITPSSLKSPVCFPSLLVPATQSLTAQPGKKIRILHLGEDGRTRWMCRPQGVHAGLLPDER